MKAFPVLWAIACCQLLTSSAGGAEVPGVEKQVDLWTDSIPKSDRPNPEEDRPRMRVCLPEKSKATGAGIVVCPGGGYLIRCEDNEGLQVARWLNEHGIAAFVLSYRVVPRATVKDALDDARLAIQYVRARSTEYGVATNRIGIIGFSAGGHLAANAAMKPLPGNPDGKLPEQRPSSRPDFLVLAYSDAGQRANTNRLGLLHHGMDRDDWMQAYVPNAEQIASAPPTFMFCTTEDGAVNGMGDLLVRMLQARVAVETHFMSGAPHGVAFAPGDPKLGIWPEMMVRWMGTSGFLSDRKSVPVKGKVLVDGALMELGSVVLKPLDAKGVARTIYIMHRTEDTGSFSLTGNAGVQPGRYQVEVHQFALHWTSTQLDPVLRRLSKKLGEGGSLSPDDEKEWLESALKRTYAPTLPGERLFKKAHPGDSNELTIEVTEAADQTVEISVSSK